MSNPLMAAIKASTLESSYQDDDDDDDFGDDDGDDGDGDDTLPHTCFPVRADLRPFVEQVPHTCGAGAPQASMTICRA